MAGGGRAPSRIKSPQNGPRWSGRLGQRTDKHVHRPRADESRLLPRSDFECASRKDPTCERDSSGAHGRAAGRRPLARRMRYAVVAQPVRQDRALQDGDRSGGARRAALRRGSRSHEEERPRGRRQEVRRAREAVSVFGLVAQSPAHDRLCPFRGPELRGRHQRLEALSAAAPGLHGRAVRAVHHGDVELQPDPRRDARPGARPEGAAGPAGARRPLSQIRIRLRRPPQHPRRQGSARRQGDGGRPLLSAEAQLHRRHQPLPRRRRQVPDDPARGRSAHAPDRSLHGARHRRRGANRRRGARPQLSGQHLVQGRPRPLEVGRARAARGCGLLDQPQLPRPHADGRHQRERPAGSSCFCYRQTSDQAPRCWSSLRSATSS